MPSKYAVAPVRFVRPSSRAVSSVVQLVALQKRIKANIEPRVLLPPVPVPSPLPVPVPVPFPLPVPVPVPSPLPVPVPSPPPEPLPDLANLWGQLVHISLATPIGAVDGSVLGPFHGPQVLRFVQWSVGGAAVFTANDSDVMFRVDFSANESLETFTFVDSGYPVEISSAQQTLFHDSTDDSLNPIADNVQTRGWLNLRPGILGDAISVVSLNYLIALPQFWIKVYAQPNGAAVLRLRVLFVLADLRGRVQLLPPPVPIPGPPIVPFVPVRRLPPVPFPVPVSPPFPVPVPLPLPGSRLRIYRGADSRASLVLLLATADKLLSGVVPLEGREIGFVPGGNFPPDRYAQLLVREFYASGWTPFQLEWLNPRLGAQPVLYFTASPRPA